MRALQNLFTGTSSYLPNVVISFLLFFMAITIFVSIADEVIEGESLPLDTAVLEWINRTLAPTFDSFFTIVTVLGGIVGVGCISAILCFYLWRMKAWRNLIFSIASIGGALLLNLALKSVFSRQRPDLWEQIVSETSFSFPSGHAMASSILAIVFVLLFWNTRYKYLVISVGAAYALLVGFSRLYLGVHYPTDILAGWSISLAWGIAVYGIVLLPRKHCTRQL